jgi:uncharacterized membrane protein
VTALMYGPVHGFMLWNLYLALVPVALAFVLFRKPTRLGVAWWVGFGAWLLFLPNAPYVLTDVVHLVDDMHASNSHESAYAYLATYAVYVSVGLVSYVVSLQLFRRFLHRVSPRRAVLPIMLVVHGLCVVAMYVGRFMRFNSWDAVLAPRTVWVSVVRVPHPNTVLILAAMFVVVGVSACVTAAVGDKALAELRRLKTR